MKTWKRYAVALVAGLALFAVGCRSTCCHDARITTAELYDVAVEGVTTGTTGHAMTVQLRLRNVLDEPVALRLRVTWLDASGRAVALDSPTDAWQKVTLAPKEVRFVDAVAPSAACTDWRAYLQGQY